MPCICVCTCICIYWRTWDHNKAALSWRYILLSVCMGTQTFSMCKKPITFMPWHIHSIYTDSISASEHSFKYNLWVQSMCPHTYIHVCVICQKLCSYHKHTSATVFAQLYSSCTNIHKSLRFVYTFCHAIYIKK